MELTTTLPSAPSRTLAACTIVSRNYLSHARTVAQSFLEQEPDGRFYVLVVDRLPEGLALGEVAFGGATRVIDPAELGFENWDELCFQYDPTELCTAVKPRLLSLLMSAYGESQLVYLDPDILVLAPFDALKRVLAESKIVLTPHMLKPIPPDGCTPSEQDILVSGAYNLGFIAVNESPETRAFLQWWDEHLQKDCRVDICRGLFVDQKWVDLVPGYFAGTTIFRDETYNIAFWNLHERTLTRRDDIWYVNGKPVTFYHFSGFDPAQPGFLSRHQTRTNLAENPALAELTRRYVQRHMQNGYATSIALEYGYGRFDNGIRVNPMLRHVYLNLDTPERGAFGNPFHASGEGSFLDWVTRPEEGSSRFSPFLEALYITRFDLFGSFPDAASNDGAAFVAWARTYGAREMGYEPELVRVGSSPPPRLTAPAGGGGEVVVQSDIFDGDFPAPGTPNAMRLKEIWEEERSVRALELWAREMEAALLKQEKTIQLYRNQLSPLLTILPRRTTHWFKNRLQRISKML